MKSVDGDHLPLSQTTDPGGLNLVTSFTYDARGNRLSAVDPMNRTTTTQYDLRNNPVKTILPDGRQELAGFDALDRRVSTTDPKSRTIRHTYWNETGLTLSLKDARNNTTTWSYNALGQQLSKAYPNGDTHAYTYDRLHRMATHTTPKNEICTYSYDLRDRRLKADWNTTTPDAISTYFANGLLKSIDNGVSKSDYSYSMRNEVTAETQTLAGQAGKVVAYSYDADGLRVGLNGPGGSPVEYQWTAKARLAGISRDGPPPLATYSYDKASRLTSTAHENGVTEAKSYNAASELLANLHLKNGATASGHQYTYDTTGRRTAETFPGTGTAPRTYGYDAADQVTSANYGGSQSDAYAYDPMGNRTSATLAAMGGSAVAYTANAANQYTAITGQAAPPVHDANGNLTFRNGVTFTWDSENRLLSVSDGTTTNTFTYDGHHRRVTKRTAVGGTVTAKTHFIYDGWNVIGEYVNADTTAGFNLTTFVPGRFLTWGADLSGSLQGAGGVGGLLLVEEISPAATTAHHFHYDGNGNVTGTTDASGAPTATYRYDAFGNTLVSTGSYATTNKYRFSTKPIDAEVANAPLCYYGYRYYDPVTGRWPSRDPIGEIGGVNLYGFVGNDAISYWDYLGLKDCGCKPDGTKIEEEQDARGKKCCPYEMGSVLEGGRNNQRRVKICGAKNDDDGAGGGGGGGGGGRVNCRENPNHPSCRGRDGGGGCRDREGYLRCLADVALNYGAGFIPGFGLTQGLLGIEMNLFQGHGMGLSGPSGGGLAGAGGAYSDHEFNSMGGQNQLDHYNDLQRRNGLGRRPNAARRSMSNLRLLGKGLGGLGNLLGAVDAGAQAIDCYKIYCK